MLTDNWIAGDGGVDTLYGLAGDDQLTAGAWNIFNRSSDSEILRYVNDSNNTDDDVLFGGKGNDVLYGSAGDNTLDGGEGVDRIYSVRTAPIPLSLERVTAAMNWQRPTC